MKILVTNDDGISSPGLWALAESLKEIGEVVVVAPDRQQSGVGSSVTLHHAVRMAPTMFNREGIKSYAVEGTPGDSVILATEKLVEGKIDLLVSGINTGSNLGNDVFVSGTVGAALARLLPRHPLPRNLRHRSVRRSLPGRGPHGLPDRRQGPGRPSSRPEPSSTSMSPTSPWAS